MWSNVNYRNPRMKMKMKQLPLAVVQALSISLGVVALSTAVGPLAFAQSNTTGTIFGNVSSPAGSSISIENTGTGLRRTATVDGSGRYQITALPPGTYKVQVLRAGAASDNQTIEVLAGQGTELNFTGAQSVEAIRVIAKRTTIDVSNATNGSTFTAKELEKLPIANNLNAIIQLAPNTTKADPRYAGGATFGGGAPSENAYYINGFPVTNALTQLGSSELPFGAIGQAQILTGGFGAEFGRSIGGVVNITTKSGTNEWEAGALFSIEPDTLRGKPKNIYYENTGRPENASTDGKLLTRRSDNEREQTRVGAYVGGPIIKDKLFAFLSFEQTRTNSQGPAVTSAAGNLGVTTNGYADNVDLINRYLAKFDWNITNNHRIEATLLGDKPTRHQKLYGYNYNTGEVGSVASVDANYKNIDNVTSSGADAQIVKYTGNLLENLTVTALYGQSKAEHINQYAGYDINSKLPQITFLTPTARAPGVNYPLVQSLTGLILPAGAEDKVKSARFDIEYTLGQHTLRAGIDDNKLKSKNAGDFTAGGAINQYRFAANPLTPIDAGGGIRVSPASRGGLGVQGYYGREQIFTDVTDAESNQKAQYIEDRYQITKNLLLTAGLRTEQYENINGDGQVFLKIKNQYNPRLSAVWDMSGDASTKIFGSAGRYSIQIPTHLAVRGASRSTFTRQFYTYTGIDAQGNPIGRVNFTEPFSANNEYGQAKDVNTVSAQNLKPSYQDEITMGFEKALNPSFNFGVKGTYRKLQQTIDDYCDQGPFDRYAERRGIDTSNWGGFGCASFNPGRANTFRVNYSGIAGQYVNVNLSAEDIGFPEKAQRSYRALDLFAEHPFRNGWFGRINYTWSRSYGNTEGQTLSDVAQTDVAATQTWDFAAIMLNAKGRLPGDRTHQIKAFGYFQPTGEWTIGGNFLAASGRPKNCLGNFDPTGLDANRYYDLGYGSAFHYCNGKAAPRGTAGNLPWDVALDANVVYQPAAAKGLSLRMDVFNVFNKQSAQAVDEVYNSGDTTVSSTYGRVISYTAPVSVKFTLQYEFK
jgi:Carboxypeptidase regulatory-like domain